MANVDRHSNGVIDPMDGVPDDRPVERDPADEAARLIAEEALSILLAVDTRAAEIGADARRRAAEIRRRADRAAEPALACLRAIALELEAVVAGLDDAASERTGRRGRGS
jgi:hypothetical protein